jgi:hypothetical protein
LLSALVALFLSASAVLSALAFHVGEWLTPGFDDLCALLGQGGDTTLKWKVLSDVQEAFHRNEVLLGRKAIKLEWAGRSLLGGILLLGGYLIYEVPT